MANLTVHEAHTFYANGILTHNCDVLSLVGRMLDRLVSGRVPKETQETDLTAIQQPTLQELIDLQPKQDGESYERI